MASEALPPLPSQPSDPAALAQAILERLFFTVGKDTVTATDRDWLHAAAYAVRDRLVERWMETQRSYYRRDVKRVYYLSMEFLLGRLLVSGLINLGILDEARAALRRLGIELERIRDLEPDAALGNGGLGRLAACLLDGMATLGLPGYGYGIRYEYGMFYQRIENGWQVEHPENWLRYGNPWEFPRPEVLYPVRFGGRVLQFTDAAGRLCHRWVDTEEVMAMAYDTPVPGYGGRTVNNLRLWSAKASRDFDLRYFNEGDYIEAVAEKNRSENLSRVLYPSDTTEMGRELRLRQEYFFVSATLQDILYRFRKTHGDLELLPEKVAIQLNDTHPALAIPELMRILLDEHAMAWEPAWEITRATFAYTNHTLLPEALETWPVELVARLLPRHLQILYEINRRFLEEVRARFPGDEARLQRLSLVEETPPRRFRMAHLAVVGSHRVNGVSALHTGLLRREALADFEALWPGRIVNCTNGITPRRWLLQANPRLAALITERLGEGWVTDLDRLAELAPLAEDAAFRDAFRRIKQANKQDLAERIHHHLGLDVRPDTLFDVQVKRIHEYKRQLLNLLHVAALYNDLRAGIERLPRTVILAGKAAPGYRMAKLIIKLAHDIAEVIHHDPETAGRLSLVFIPNYDVSTAADIIPAAELSQQISTAGTEASGTGNMKLALNGAVTLGTLDGANIEIREAVGGDAFFAFGLDAEEAARLRRARPDPRTWLEADARLARVIDQLASGFFSPDDRGRYRPLVDALLGEDRFLVLADFTAYAAAQEAVEAAYRDPARWWAMAVRNTAAMGRFSIDRTVRDYAARIWGVEPVTPRRRPRPRTSPPPRLPR
ncbi:glycogen/starch/alpha-glucan phosphorylase [Inmirania thermothiophila]|uniref:Alpha-1,4 glucan phosphorylase n=1 Tax=Inmirania thermothiophila TaxID=1750597 RepID=A0A3N1XSF0_9GAMM|nr:glycogen/starch/alpha-glucan phosphorylase [Inmirania thermothiophila]ROR29583.1 glycogen phosphorylase [Inmirania thermothiophila]